MTLETFLIWLVIGLIAGWLASAWRAAATA